MLVRIPVQDASEVRSTRPIYDTYIRPEEKRIVWYRFPKTLPQVSGVEVPYAPQPQGLHRSPETIIAASDPSTKSNQLIWRPDPPPSLAPEIQSPNLIALNSAQVPPAPKPKPFTPPPARAAPPQQPAPAPVQIDAPNIDVGTMAANAPILKSRQFVAPPPQLRQSEPAPVLQAPGVALQAGADQGGTNVLRQLRAAAPPPPSRLVSPPSGPGGQGGLSGTPGQGSQSSGGTPASGTGTTIAVVGLNPSDRLPGTFPEGTRPGLFSTASAIGSPGAPGSGGGIAVPGLRVEGSPGTAGAGAGTIPSRTAAPTPGTSVLYTQTIAGPMPSTFSAPLHPSSRSIPRPIESRFHDRTVYALVIPAPVLPEYAGDWTLWFAERAGEAGSARIRAPVPYRKIQQSGSNAKGERTGRHLLLPILIAKNGTVQPLEASSVSERAIEDLRCWEFQPAMRNGSPVEVEAVLDFVFRDGP